jgi:uncharacterized protein
MTESKLIIDKLGLRPHPEGGFFCEVYRSRSTINAARLTFKYEGDRNVSTSIYYLLEGSQISHFHKLRSDEIWHFYRGSALVLHCISEGCYSKIIVGNKIDDNEVPQYIVPAETWFAAEVMDKNSFSLLGCTVAPGFDYRDFELAIRDDLVKQFPQYKEIITRFT